MPRKCTICEHKKRKEIDLALAVDGASFRNIASRFKVGYQSLKRHMDNGHISPEAITAKQVQEIHRIDSFQEHHQAIRDDLESQKGRAREAEDARLELLISREIIRLHDIDGRASGVYREKLEHTGSVKIGAMTDAEIEREIRGIIKSSTQ
jgi:hypothetical protein